MKTASKMDRPAEAKAAPPALDCLSDNEGLNFDVSSIQSLGDEKQLSLSLAKCYSEETSCTEKFRENQMTEHVFNILGK